MFAAAFLMKLKTLSFVIMASIISSYNLIACFPIISSSKALFAVDVCLLNSSIEVRCVDCVRAYTGLR